MSTRIDLEGQTEALIVVEDISDVRSKIERDERGWITFTEKPKKNPNEAREVDVAVNKITTVRPTNPEGQKLHTKRPAVIGDRA